MDPDGLAPTGGSSRPWIGVVTAALLAVLALAGPPAGASQQPGTTTGVPAVACNALLANVVAIDEAEGLPEAARNEALGALLEQAGAVCTPEEIRAATAPTEPADPDERCEAAFLVATRLDAAGYGDEARTAAREALAGAPECEIPPGLAADESFADEIVGLVRPFFAPGLLIAIAVLLVYSIRVVREPDARVLLPAYTGFSRSAGTDKGGAEAAAQQLREEVAGEIDLVASRQPIVGQRLTAEPDAEGFRLEDVADLDPKLAWLKAFGGLLRRHPLKLEGVLWQERDSVNLTLSLTRKSRVLTAQRFSASHHPGLGASALDLRLLAADAGSWASYAVARSLAEGDRQGAARAYPALVLLGARSWESYAAFRRGSILHDEIDAGPRLAERARSEYMHALDLDDESYAALYDLAVLDASSPDPRHERIASQRLDTLHALVGRLRSRPRSRSGSGLRTAAALGVFLSGGVAVHMRLRGEGGPRPRKMKEMADDLVREFEEGSFADVPAPLVDTARAIEIDLRHDLREDSMPGLLGAARALVLGWAQLENVGHAAGWDERVARAPLTTSRHYALASLYAGRVGISETYDDALIAAACRHLAQSGEGARESARREDPSFARLRALRDEARWKDALIGRTDSIAVPIPPQADAPTG